MSNNTIDKYCPLIKDNCRTDCMFITLITKNKYECSMVRNTLDIGSALGSIDEQLRNLSDPDYIKFIKNEV